MLAVAANNIAVNAVGVIALRASLHGGDPGLTGAGELAGGSPAYARKTVAWNPAASSSAAMTAAAVFDIPPGANPTHAGYWTAGGVWLGGGPLSAAPGTYTAQGTFVLDAASMLAVGAALPTAYDLAVLARKDIDLVAYLPLGVDYTDWTGHGHNATPHGTVGVAAGDFLDGSSATVFNGLDAWLQIANDPALSITDTGELYVEYYLKPAVQNFTIAEGTGPYVYHFSKLSCTTLGDDPDQDEIAGRLYNWTSYRPSRLSGYAFQPAGGKGAGSYSEPSTGIPLDAYTHYGIAYNINDTSTFAGGYTLHYRNGKPLDQDSMLIPYNVVPVHGTAPFRIGRGPASFFQGKIVKVAIYRAVPDPADVLARHRLLVPQVGGSIELLRDIGTVAKTTSGTKCTIPIGPAGVPAGATNVVTVASAYTAGTPSVGDSKGNLYSLTRTSANTALTKRESEFTAPVNAALEDGDAVQATLTAAVNRRVMAAEAYTGIAFSTPVDKHNSGQGTSATPGTSTFTGTTGQADELVRGGLLVAGPNTDTFTPDSVGEFTDLAPVGTNVGDGNDITLHRAFKSVNEIGSFRWQPGIDLENWLMIVSAQRAGDSTPTPPATGTGRYIDPVGDVTATGSGTTLVGTVAGDGVPIGHYVAVWVHGDWTSAGPTMVDSKLNIYTRHKTLPSTGNTTRMALFVAPVTAALVAGDTYTVTFPSAVTRRGATAHEFSGLSSPVVLNQSNNNSNTGTNPNTTMPATTHADAVLLGFVCVEGPVEQSADFEPDAGHQWTHLPAVGTTGAGTSSDDRTIYPAYRIVAATGAYQFNPNLDASAKYIVGATAFNAG